MENEKQTKKRKQADLSEFDVPEQSKKSKCAPQAKSSTERSRERRERMSLANKLEENRKTAERNRTTYKNMDDDEKRTYIDRRGARYHNMPAEDRQKYIDACGERMLARHNNMEVTEKAELNAEKAKKAKEVYHNLDKEAKEAKVARSKDNRNKRKQDMAIEESRLFQEHEARRKRSARESESEKIDRQAPDYATNLDEELMHFWSLRSSGQLEPSMNLGK